MWVQYMMTKLDMVHPSPIGFWNGFVSVLIMTAGTIFLMWIGEQIDEYGIGNGISLIIMAGIVARIPDALFSIFLERGQFRESVLRLGGSGTAGDIGLDKVVGLMIRFV